MDIYDSLDCLGVKAMFMNGVMGDARHILVPDTYFIETQGYATLMDKLWNISKTVSW